MLNIKNTIIATMIFMVSTQDNIGMELIELNEQERQLIIQHRRHQEQQTEDKIGRDTEVMNKIAFDGKWQVAKLAANILECNSSIPFVEMVVGLQSGLQIFAVILNTANAIDGIKNNKDEKVLTAVCSVAATVATSYNNYNILNDKPNIDIDNNFFNRLKNKISDNLQDKSKAALKLASNGFEKILNEIVDPEKRKRRFEQIDEQLNTTNERNTRSRTN